jgi:hypothetical protein
MLGGLYAVAVAGSRVYLADHYPPDVIGGMLCAVAAAFIVTGLAALPALQPFLRRLDAPNTATAEARHGSDRTARRRRDGSVTQGVISDGLKLRIGGSRRP